MARVKFSITDNNGVVLTDKHTGQPHSFDFPFAPEAFAMVEGWMERVGTKSVDKDGKEVFTPKYPNIAEVAREILFDAFKRMIPAEVVEVFEEQKAEIEKAKEGLFWQFFGMIPPE